MTVAGAQWVGGAAQLEILHALEEPEQLIGQGITIQPGLFEGDEQLVGGFEGGEATRVRLLFDHKAAGRRRG